MAERTVDDRVAELVHVLRGVGVSGETIAEGHDLSGIDSLVDDLVETLGDPDEPRLYDRLHETIARSDRGLECPRDHDLDEATAALSAALDSYDCTLSVIEADGSVVVEATDAAGDTRTTTTSIPTGAADPLPVLAHAVEDLLSGTGLSVVLLTERDDVWRLALLPERRLTDLQDRLGLRLTVFGRPLLCADQPRSFVEGTATSYGTATDDGLAAVTAGAASAVETAEQTVPTPETPANPDSVGDGAHDPGTPNPPVDDGAMDRLAADLSAAFESRDGDEDESEGEDVEDIVNPVTGGDDSGLDDAFDAVEAAAGADGEGPESDVVGTPERVVDESVGGVLAEVDVVDAGTDDLDLDAALASMAGEFDAAPTLPEPLAAATNSEN